MLVLITLLKQLERLPSAQLDEAIPVTWIEDEIIELKSNGKAFSYILAELIGVMVRKWRKEHE